MTTAVHRSPKLLDQMRNKLRVMHYAWKTEQAYVMWIERFLRFHRERNRGRWMHPLQMGKTDIEQYLTYLAVDKDVAASTQNQALSAILFLYGKVMEIKLHPIWQFEGRCELASVKRRLHRTD